MIPLKNEAGLSLAMSVWLAHDEYTNGSDEHPGMEVVSATALLKPTRQIILSRQVPESDRIGDVSDFIASKYGTALHDSIEKAWIEGYASSMKRLGYPKKIIDRVKINPDPETVTEDDFPVYLEQRQFREITVDGMTFIISGKFDQIINGELNDTKTTSVYAYINRSKEEDYVRQMSMYRWINPKLVTSDTAMIQHIFTDWQGFAAKTTPGYPASRVIEFPVDLLGERETENLIRTKIREVIANHDLDQEDMIRCTDKELWKSDPSWKYYSDPAKAAAGGKSTKNFTNEAAARTHAAKAGKGVVVTVPGQVKACGYCPAQPICLQAKEYQTDD